MLCYTFLFISMLYITGRYCVLLFLRVRSKPEERKLWNQTKFKGKPSDHSRCVFPENVDILSKDIEQDMRKWEIKYIYFHHFPSHSSTSNPVFSWPLELTNSIMLWVILWYDKPWEFSLNQTPRVFEFLFTLWFFRELSVAYLFLTWNRGIFFPFNSKMLDFEGLASKLRINRRQQPYIFVIFIDFDVGRTKEWAGKKNQNSFLCSI